MPQDLQRPASERTPTALIAAYVVAQFANWLALLTPAFITVALRIPQIVAPADRAVTLGVVLGIGAAAAALAGPVFGALSDRTRSRFGRRRPWMVSGVIGGGLGLTLMALAPNAVLLGAGWLVTQLSLNANQAALNAILPDAIPPARRGTVAGLLGLTTTAAALGGSFLVQFTADPLPMFLLPFGPAVLATVVLVLILHDRPLTSAVREPFRWGPFLRGFWISPRRFPDFGWAFLSRALVFLGSSLLSIYQIYFLTDRIGIVEDDLPETIFRVTLVTSIITIAVSMLGGWCSDRFHRRKPFVAVGALVGASGMVVVATANSFQQFLVGVAVVSFGTGLYYAVDIALVASVLPDARNHAKDMGTFQIANALPQVIAPVIAPLLLSVGGVGAMTGYTALFLAAAVFAVLGALAVRPIRTS